MQSNIGDNFIQALNTLETQGDTEPMKQLFSDNCRVWNVQMHEPLTGIEGALKFWTQYRKTFEQIQSQFTHREESDHCVVLEWRSKGNLPLHKDIEYDGATILEHDGEKITAFRSYFDTKAISIQTH